MSIHVLSAEVVDQIAAGEVVERPSHLVKEIVENSLDAKATQVHIEFAHGGRFVKITDNGVGISAEDLPKALERFATSKISQTADLWKLHTYGFRGEALASIAAVSHLTLTSKPSVAESAMQMVSEFGRKTTVDPVGGSNGTTILVERLFENVPARLKFLKSDAAEHSAIKNTLKAMALSHPQSEFRIQENNKLVAFWPACRSHKERAEQILEIKPLYEGYAERENVRARVVFADPHHVAKTSKNIWLFAQNRWIQDRSLQAAVMEAYRSLLMYGEFPAVVAFVETDTDAIDVNIHPTKSQVKFQEPSLAFRAVQAALRDALEQAPWLQRSQDPAATSTQHVNFTATPAARFAPQPMAEPLRFADPQLERAQYAKKQYVWNPPADTNKNYVKEPTIEGSVLQALNQAAAGRSELFSESQSSGPVNANPSASPKTDPLTNQFTNQVANVSTTSIFTSTATSNRTGHWSSLEVIGQANQTYLVCQARDRIVFVDQHAAHERVAYERLMSAWRGGRIDVQDFLFPLAIDLSPEKLEAIQPLFKDIERLGVHLENLGPGTLGVKAAPLIIKDSILSSVLDKVATECLEQGGSYSLERVIGDICATMACHSVVRAGQVLSLEQMRNLLSEMDQFPLSSFCPHGRPVSVEYLFYKLEKDFGRIV